MNRIITCVMAGIVMSVSNGLFAANWTYDSAAKTISDGEWVLNAVRSGNNLSIGTSSNTGAMVSYSGTDGILDLSKPISDGTTTYTLNEIRSKAFQNSADVVKVVLPGDSLKTIGASAFNGSQTLREVTPFLPDSIQTISSSAFFNCTNLVGDLKLCGTSVVINANNNNPSYGTFANTKISSVKITSSTTGIPQFCFDSCTNLVSIILPDDASLKSIGSAAFRNCSSLETVTPFLPSSITSIGNRAFQECKRLKGDLVLNSDSLTISAYGNSTWASPFRLTQISTVDLTAPMTELPLYTFSQMPKLEKISLPETLVTLNSKSIGMYTGNQGDKPEMLTNVTFRGSMPTTIANNVFDGVTKKGVVFYVPKNSEGWDALWTDANFAAIDEATLADFKTRFPDVAMKPRGLWTVGGTQAWVCEYGTSLPGFMLIVR